MLNILESPRLFLGSGVFCFYITQLLRGRDDVPFLIAHCGLNEAVKGAHKVKNNILLM